MPEQNENRSEKKMQGQKGKENQFAQITFYVPALRVVADVQTEKKDFTGYVQSYSERAHICKHLY